MPLYERCNEPTEETAVRRNNRVLRHLARTLRRRIETGKEYTDTLFIELCSTNPAAELAMRRLWEEGGFQPPCGPEDYHEIVDTSLRALKAYHEAAQNGPTAGKPAP